MEPAGRGVIDFGMRGMLRRLFGNARPPAGPIDPEARRRAWNRRLRIMVRHTRLIAVVVVLLCAGAGGIAYYFATLPTQLRVAVGPPHSEDARVIQAIAAQLARDRAEVRLHIRIVEGGTRAAAALDRAETDIAVVRRDTGMPKDGRAVAILRKNVVVFIVPSAPASAGKSGRPSAKAKAPPEKIADLIGRRLGVIGRSPNNIELLKVILRQYGIAPETIELLSPAALAKPSPPGKIGVVQFDPANVSSAIRDSSVDAIMSVGPVSSPITADAILAATRGKEPPAFLSIGAAEAIAERSPAYEATEIKAGAFGGSPPRPEESVDTIGVNHYIVARRQLGEQVIADLTKHLFAVRQTLAVDMPSASKIEKPDTDKDAAVPVHPGAAAYLDGEMKTFFDRYSDAMYWGLMLFSLVGSALAGLMSYSKANDRVRRLRVLERLLDITKAARSTETIQAIDALQLEMDNIQAGMIREVEGNSLDETAMAAFSVSFERAAQAIADRRAALLNQGPAPLAAVASL